MAVAHTFVIADTHRHKKGVANRDLVRPAHRPDVEHSIVTVTLGWDVELLLIVAFETVLMAPCSWIRLPIRTFVKLVSPFEKCITAGARLVLRGHSLPSLGRNSLRL